MILGFCCEKRQIISDFDEDNDITKSDLIDVLDRLTNESVLEIDEKSEICDIVSITRRTDYSSSDHFAFHKVRFVN